MLTLSRLSNYDERDCIPMRPVGSSSSSSIGPTPVMMTTRTNGFHPPVHQIQHQQRLQQLHKQHMQRHKYFPSERSDSPMSHFGAGGDYLGDDSCVLVPEERVGLLAKNARLPATQQHQRNGDTARRNGEPPGKRKRPSGMAPTTTIETVTIVRPLKVIAFICGGLGVLLLILCLASSEWLLAQGWRQGLFVHCVSEDAIHPLPFGISSDAGCFPVRTRGYIVCSAILCVVAVILDAVATLLTGLGLWSQDSTNKYKFYRFALYIMIGSLVTVLIALIVYPVCFSGELDQGNRDLWEFGWAYGVAWGAAIFLFGGIVLLLLDKESEEIYYKERTVVHESGAGSDAASGSKG